MSQLLLPAPGESTCFRYEWQHPEQCRASELGRRWRCGTLLIHFDNMHITQRGERGMIEIDILRQSNEQLMRGDLESRTITVTAYPTRWSWRAAYRIARAARHVRPGMVVFIEPEDWEAVREIAVPQLLSGCLMDSRLSNRLHWS